jgi:tetratricopeptide (TPR) repeat protein
MRMTNRAVAYLTILATTAHISVSHAQQPSPVQQAIAQLKLHHPQQAMDLLTAGIAANPNDAAANLLAASTAIELNQPAQAVTYGERARALEPNNWKIDTALVTAYAMAGKTGERDAERSKLHALHDTGTEPDAKQTSGFLLDRFDVKKYTVDAVEYFSPVGKFHIYYCFFVRNGQGQRVWQINAQSDDFNQASWAKAYPQQAAAGQRQFQITGEGGGVRTDYRTFSGSANYDWIKARVIEIINAQSVPFPGESNG